MSKRIIIAITTIITLVLGITLGLNLLRQNIYDTCTHTDTNVDFICDTCKASIPFSENTENKQLQVKTANNETITISGNMPKEAKAEVKEVSKVEAINLAQKHVKGISSNKVLSAYDISLNANNTKFQPKEFNQSVKVKVSDLKLDSAKTYAMLHIMDNGESEIIPIKKLNKNEIEFTARSFSVYIVIEVENNSITFEGENYKVFDTNGEEYINGSIVAAGTNFNFYIMPNKGYGVTSITCTNSAGNNVITTSGTISVMGGLIESVTEDLTIVVTTVQAPQITTQPKDAKVALGEEAIFSVEATGTGLTYQWQYKISGDEFWQDCDDTFTSEYKTNTLTVDTSAMSINTEELTITNDLNGYEFKCIVTDSSVNGLASESDIAKLSVAQDTVIETIEVKIPQIEISSANTIVTLSQTIYQHDGNPKKPTATVTVNGTQITEKTDFEVSYANNTEVGTASVIITGIGNYTGTVIENFVISSTDVEEDEFVVDTTGPIISNVAGTVGDTIVITADIADPDAAEGVAGSGVNTAATKYAITTENSAPAVDSAVWQSSNTFTNTYAGDIYVWVKAEDNLGNVSILEEALVLTAKVYYTDNTTDYVTLKDAFENAPTGSTITVLDNVEDRSEAIVPAGKSFILDTAGFTITKTDYSIVNNGTLIVVGTGSLTTNKVEAQSLASAVKAGDYVDYPVTYNNVSVYGTTKLTGWRVISKDVDLDGNVSNGTVNLISAGNPLTFYHDADGKKSAKEITTNFFATPISETENCVYRKSGFTPDKSLKQIFTNEYTAMKADGETPIVRAVMAEDIFKVTGHTSISTGTTMGLGNPSYKNLFANNAVYWIANAYAGNLDRMYFIAANGSVNFDNAKELGVRPVVSLNNQVNTTGQNAEGVWQITMLSGSDSDSTPIDTLIINNGTLTIAEGTFESTGIAIKSTTANLTIGEEGNGVSTSIPVIQGATNAIESANGFNFYDGILKGITAAHTGATNNVEDGYTVRHDTETTGDVTYNTAYLIRLITDAVITLDPSTLTYNGVAQTPTTITVTVDGVDLTAGTDYDVAVKNNVNVGSATDATVENRPTVTITAKGNYAGTKDAYFTIEKATPTLTVTPNAVTIVDGEKATVEVTYIGDATLSVTSNEIATAKLNSNTVTITGEKAGTTEIIVSATGGSNYKDTEATITVKVLGANYTDNTTNYATLKEAFENATTGSTITVLQDVTDRSEAIVPAGKSFILDTAGFTITKTDYSIVNNGTLKIEGTGKVVTGGEEAQASQSLAEAVTVGDYVDYPVEYNNVPGWDDMEAELTGWRVISKDVDLDGNASEGTVNLVSAGIPLTWKSADTIDIPATTSATMLRDNFFSIPIDNTVDNTFRKNGFENDNLINIFTNDVTALKDDGVTPKVRAMKLEDITDITGGKTEDINNSIYNNLFNVGGSYWLASAVDDYMLAMIWYEGLGDNYYFPSGIGQEQGIRPVVSLKSNLLTTGKNASDAWTLVVNDSPETPAIKIDTLIINNGTLTIAEGTFEATGVAIQSTTANLTIGEEGNGVSTSIPVIQGATNAIESANGFNFYDGILKGVTAAHTGATNNVEDGYTVKYATETVGDVTYNTAILVGANYADDTTSYATLKDAFENSATGSTITVLQDVEDRSEAIVPAGKSFILDTAGFTITKTDYSIVNNGTLKIEGTGKVVTGGEESQAGQSLADAVEVGDYVDYPIEYDNVAMNDEDFGIESEYLSGWRVISKDVDLDGNIEEGTVNLVSAGCPLTLKYNSDSATTVATNLKDNFLGIAIDNTGSNTYYKNGFLLYENLTDVFNNELTALKDDGVTPKVRAMKIEDITDITEGSTSDLANVNYEKLFTNSEDYWLASANNNGLYCVYNDGYLYQFGNNFGFEYGVRPVVSLKQNVLTTGKNASDVWTLTLGGGNSEDTAAKIDTLIINNGTLTIAEGTFESDGVVISSTTANLTIGEAGNGVSTTIPVIQGATNAIESANGFNFYDGILKGITAAHTGATNNVEDGYTVKYATETAGDVTYNTAYLIRLITDAVITLDPATSTYNGVAQTPTITVTVDGVDLTSGTDYDIAVKNNTNVGSATDEVVANRPTVTITAKGNYAGTKDAYFTINPKAITVTWTNTSLTYKVDENGIPVAQAPVVDGDNKIDGVNGEVINVVVTGEQTNANTGYIAQIDLAQTTVTGGQGKLTNYILSPLNTTFAIVAKSLAGANITLTPDSFEYDGTAKEPGVSVIVDKAVLVKGSDYSVDHDTTVDVGTKTVTIEGSGNYTGTATANFEITAVAPTLTLENVTTEYTGTAVEVGEVKVSYPTNGVKPNGTVTYTYYTDAECNTLTTAANSGAASNGAAPKNAGTYYVKATMDANGNYTAATSNVATITINVKQITVEWDELTLQYTGSNQVPTVKTNNKIAGVNGEEINVKVDGAKSAVGGPYEATASIESVTGGLAENYELTEGSKKANFYITNDNVKLTATVTTPSYVYDGSIKKPAVTVTAEVDGNTVPLTEGEDADYVVKYDESETAKDVGTKTITIIGKGDYAGKGTPASFTITAKELTATPVAGQNKVYGETDPTLEVEFSGNIDGETPGKTGTLTRAEGQEVGTYVITQGTLALADNGAFKASNYTLKFVDGVTFEITRKDISELNPSLEQKTFEYTGLAITPGLNTITYAGKDLVAGTDYEITYDTTKNINAGQATATVTGKGNFDGEVTLPFTIEKKVINVTWTNNGDLPFNNQYQVPVAGTNNVIAGVNGEEIHVTVGDAQKEVGSYTAEIKSAEVVKGQARIENYDLQNTSTTFNIVPSSDIVLNVELAASEQGKTYTYTGTAHTPAVKVTAVVDGETIDVDSTEYTVSYVNNVNANTADSIPTITVTPNSDGNYASSNPATTTFTIDPARLTVVWGEISFLCTGAPQKPTAEDLTGVNGETVKISVAGEQSAVGNYEVTASVGSVTKSDGTAGKTTNYALDNATTPFEIYMGNYSDGTKHYMTLADAFNGAPNEGIITVLQDVEEDASEAIVPENKELTLNTAGYTITKTANCIIVSAGSTLNIEGNGSITSSDNSLANLINNHGTLNIREVTIESNILEESHITLQGAFNMYSGTIKSSVFAIHTNMDTTSNVFGGNIIAEGTNDSKIIVAIANGKNAKLNITGGYINAQNNGTGSARAIYGGENDEITISNATVTSSGYAIEYWIKSKGKLTISSGAEIKAINSSSWIHSIAASETNLDLTIEEGAYIYSDAVALNISEGTVKILGGTIESDCCLYNTANYIIGDNSNAVNPSSPVFIAEIYTFNTVETPNLSFYDGILKGKQEAILGDESVIALPDGYGIKDGNDGTYYTATLAPLEKPSAPTITGTVTSDTWSTSSVTVTITANATAPVGGQTLQYKLNDGEWTNYTEALTISAEGITEVTARAVNTRDTDNTSLMSDEVTYIVKVDTVNPTVETNNITFGETASITLTDATSGVVGYIISENNETPTATSEWTEIAATNNTVVNYTPSKATTYYVWAIDDAGNISDVLIIIVARKDISELNPSLEQTTFEYDGTNHTPDAIIELNGNRLVNGTDYYIEYTPNKHAGPVTATITGKGNFTGSIQLPFTIETKALTVTWSNTELEYVKGLQQAPTATVITGVDGEEITLAVTGKQEAVGTGYKAEIDLVNSSITGTDSKLSNYTFSPEDTTFDIVLPDGSDFVITYVDTDANGVYTYNGTAIEPEIKVTTESGIELTAGTDYDVEYTNNIDAGTADSIPTITVTGMNSYSGINAVKTFTINKKPLTVNWTNTRLEYVKDLAQKPTATVTTDVDKETINLAVSGEQVNVGSYTATIDMDASTVTGGQGKLDNYTFSPVETTFEIVLPEGTDFVIEYVDTTANGVYTYNGTAIEPQIVVTTTGGVTLTAGTDYNVEYTNNIDAGTVDSVPTITVTGINSYTGIDEVKTFTINKKQVTVKWSNVSVEFNNAYQIPTADIIDEVADEEINLVVSGEQINVGNYTVIIDMDATTVTKGRENLNNYELLNTQTAFEIKYPNVEFEITLESNSYDYDGNEHKPKVTITVVIDGNEITLVEDTDFEVEYFDFIEPGPARIEITGLGNYANKTDEVTYTINKIDRDVTIIMNDYVYGSTLPTPSLSNNDEPGDTVFYYNTVNSVDGAIEWSTVADANSLDAGTYYMFATIEETAHYNNKTTDIVEFEVTKAIAVHPTVENKVYNGKDQVGVYGGQGIILSGVTEAKNADTYTAYGTLEKNYKWADGDSEREYVWTIDPLDINNATITLDELVFNYSGSAHKPGVTATFGTDTLVKDQDYELKYFDNIEIGTAEVEIKGINNFTGTVTKEFVIRELLLGRIELDTQEYFYTGSEIKPIESVYDTEGNLLIRDKDYTLYFVNNVKVGTATIGAVGCGNYTGTVETTFSIIGNIIGNAEITLSGFPLIYDGLDKCPDVTVVYEGVTLVHGRDYEVIYADNIDAGENTATATIIGIGRFYGSVEKKFSIMKADREGYILPGKAMLVGQAASLPFFYEGDVGDLTMIVNDTTIASVVDREYYTNDILEVRGLAAGKTTIKVIVAATNNYNEEVLNTEVTVFENEESTYPIYGTVIINDNDEFTISPRVLLSLNVDFGDYMYISESNVTPSVDNPEWYEFSTKMPYVFDDTEGVKTIYVWFKDKKGNISKMATDSIILDYDADVEFKDNVILDQTEIDQTAPDVETYEHHNDGVDVKVTFNQEDIMVDGVRSGTDHATIRYGYKEADSSDEYTWQESSIITGLKYNTLYIFVTEASDRAGNGPTLSEERRIRTERKFALDISLEDKDVQYDGNVQNIDEADIVLIDDIAVTGTITYTYYIDAECTILTTSARDGSNEDGGAPRMPGSYYVKATLTGDDVYYNTESNVANLRIGWDISKTEDDNVFAYVERTAADSDEFILHITGEGNMADLSELLIKNNDESMVHWDEYKDKIINLDIGNTSEDNITSIGSEMFSDLTKITEITIPDTVTSIGDYAFEGCTLVTNVIKIPTSVGAVGSGAFKDVNTPEFEVAFGSASFDTIDGVLTDAEHKVLVAYPNGKVDERYEIPEIITIIRESSFSGADNLKNVVIPNGVTTIEGKAFYECTNLAIIEIEDRMVNDLITDLNTVGTKTFDKIAKNSVIYTFDKAVAGMFIEGTTHVGEDTKVYYPPVIDEDMPIDMNGAVGYTVKFIVDTTKGNPEETFYQWYKVVGDTVTLIPGATGKEYTTESLTAADDNTYYYCIAYNDQYYFDRGYVASRRAKLTLLDNANYMVERGTYNSYLFETLQDAFDFAENDDVIKPLKTVNDEADAILSGNRSIKIDLNTNTINLTGKIEIDSGSKVELVGNGTITKSGEYIFENKGELVLNGEFNLINTTGFGIKADENSKVTYTAGNITVDSNAIYAENATVNINGASANIVASTSNANANAITLHGNTKFDMSAGNVSIGYKAEPTSGNISGIYVVGETEGSVNISGGTIKATANVAIADAIVNAGASDVTISGDANIIGSRSGIMTTNTNEYGDIYVQGGTITGGVYGILNNAKSAKIVLGTEGKGVIVTTPVVVGEKAAIFNAKEKNTLEMYDGILYSHGPNVIYEELNNTSLTIPDSNTEAVYTEDGRPMIKTEFDYFIVAEENVSYNSSTYTAAYLKQYKAPTVAVDVKDQTVKVGEKATFEIVVSGGIPAVYNYKWQVSRDGGITWSDVTVGTGANTSKYITPITTITMDGYKYRCLVDNGKKELISRAALLTVTDVEQIGDYRPVVRFEFTNGKVVSTEMIDGKETKVVNLQMIVKSFNELKTLDVNGTNIVGQKEYNFTDGSMRLSAYSPNGIDYGPIKITKEVNGNEEVVEYTYTYNVKMFVNGLITVKALDVEGRDNTATQVVDLLFDLKVDYYKSDISKTSKNVSIVFFANKPVKPTKSIVDSYINSTYLDLVSVDRKEYSYKYRLELNGPLSETIFWFEDEFKNQAYVTVEEILRVEYKDIKFNIGTTEIKDMTVIDAFNTAQELEAVTEVNSSEEMQSRYGLNSVQSDVFMSRARDIGALSILNSATVAKSYDGVFTSKIEATVTSKESAYDTVTETVNIYVAAAAKDRVENELSNKNRKYVDIITKDVSLYKGMMISDFVIDDTAPYMYTNNNKVSNITSTTIAGGGFRATIIPK